MASERDDLIELPKLPPVDRYGAHPDGNYSAESMRSYAREAIAAHAATISRLEAEVEAGWQPIETAPKDGTPILVLFGMGDDAYQAVVFWDGAWVSQGAGSSYRISYRGATHWRPLPAPPRTEGERG